MSGEQDWFAFYWVVAAAAVTWFSMQAPEELKRGGETRKQQRERERGGETDMVPLYYVELHGIGLIFQARSPNLTAFCPSPIRCPNMN